MKTIINTREKYNRNNEQRKMRNRNANGLTSREQEKADKIEAISKMLVNGAKQKEICKVLGLAKSTVSEYVKEIKALKK